MGHDEERVDDRKGQRQHRTADGQYDRGFGGAGDGDGGEEEADEHAPRVAHEDLRRWFVPRIEADEAPAEGGHDDEGEDVGADDGDGGEGESDGDGHDGGQRVHAVDEVEGVDDADDPDDGEEPAGVAEGDGDAGNGDVV